jgi:hypothetical protein
VGKWITVSVIRLCPWLGVITNHLLPLFFLPSVGAVITPTKGKFIDRQVGRPDATIRCASEAASCPRHKVLNEDNTYSLHITPPLLAKHFVVGCFSFQNLNLVLQFQIVVRFTHNVLKSKVKAVNKVLSQPHNSHLFNCPVRLFNKYCPKCP